MLRAKYLPICYLACTQMVHVFLLFLLLHHYASRICARYCTNAYIHKPVLALHILVLALHVHLLMLALNTLYSLQYVSDIDIPICSFSIMADSSCSCSCTSCISYTSFSHSVLNPKLLFKKKQRKETPQIC